MIEYKNSTSPREGIRNLIDPFVAAMLVCHIIWGGKFATESPASPKKSHNMRAIDS
jgi:hypothetical protein